jgi:hypothetical protein
MSDKNCPNCGRLFKQDEEVRATVLSRYVELKSKVCYALQRPHEVISIEHHDCQTPMGRVEGD